MTFYCPHPYPPPYVAYEGGRDRVIYFLKKYVLLGLPPSYTLLFLYMGEGGGGGLISI